MGMGTRIYEGFRQDLDPACQLRTSGVALAGLCP